jgi:ABC-type phosphate transport system ATPase subunit
MLRELNFDIVVGISGEDDQVLEAISLKFTEFARPLRIPAQGVTIFVGPNNSGKSLVLREIEQDIVSHQRPETKILHDLEVDWMAEEALNEEIAELTKKAPAGISPDNVYVSGFDQNGQLYGLQANRNMLLRFMREHIEPRWISSQFLRMFFIRLDGRTRFALTSDRPRGDLLGPAQHMLMQLFADDQARKRVRDIVFDAFGVYFTIEQLSENLRIRLSATEPNENEQSWNDAARRFHGKALHIKEASDGVQAFVGILCAVLSGDYRAILIDEPEAFLHPPLARKLGQQLTNNLKANGTLMASTHSPDFLMGCLQASPHVRVVRLEYSNGRSKGKIVDSAVLTKLFKAPLLRSANVISALFHDGVVVTESDNDRAFYAEIYYRLAEQEKGYPSILFVNAQNKQTIRDIIGPLRQFGIPAAAVVDVDILKDGGGDWIPWLKSAHVPTALHVGLGHQRATLHKLFVDQKLDMENGGIKQLGQEDQAAANELFDQVRQYGVFAVRNGEVESWLPGLGIGSKKATWTVQMLERLGSDPLDVAYVRPASGDVWDFMRDVVSWVRDPGRKGTD